MPMVIYAFPIALKGTEGFSFLFSCGLPLQLSHTSNIESDEGDVLLHIYSKNSFTFV